MGPGSPLTARAASKGGEGPRKHRAGWCPSDGLSKPLRRRAPLRVNVTRSPMKSDHSPDGSQVATRSSGLPKREQRKHRRVAANLGVRVYWQAGPGALCDALSIVRDVSAGGFGILLQRELSRGELISVETAEGSLQCVVRHVRKTPRGWLIGVEVMAASDGSNHRRSLDNLRIVLAAGEKSSQR